jgi:hypothetical protein
VNAAARAALLRLVLAGAVGLVLASVWGEKALHAGLPWLQRAFELAAPDFRVLEFGIVQVDAEKRLAVAVTLSRTTVVGARVLVPDPRGRAEAVTPLAHALHGAMLALVASAAWPAASWRSLLCRGATVLPLAAALVLVDAPLVLAASLRQLLIDSLAPGQASLLLAWSAFLRGGGRYVLALLAAAAAAGLCARVRRAAA